MSRRATTRRRELRKRSLDGSVGLPSSIAWSTIVLLILVGLIYEFGRFQPALDATFGVALIVLILAGGLISIGLFKVGRRRDRLSERANLPPKAERILDSEIQAWWIAVIAPLEKVLARYQLKPNHITAISFGFSFVGFVFFCLGWMFLAGWVILLGGTLDILDGRIARKTGRESRQGAFFDSVLDRYGEILIFLGLCVHYRGSLLPAVVVLALVGSLMVSYTRARAEGLGVTCKEVGVMQRPERVVFLGFGAVFSSILYMLRGTLGSDYGPYLMVFVLGLIAVLANYTALSRLVYVMRELKSEDGD